MTGSGVMLVRVSGQCDVCHADTKAPQALIRKSGNGWDVLCRICTLHMMEMAIQAGKIAEAIGGSFDVVGFDPEATMPQNEPTRRN